MTWPWWKVTNVWNKNYVSLQAALWLKCLLPTRPKLREDPMLSAVLDWLKAQKQTDLKLLLTEHASSEEVNLILCN